MWYKQPARNHFEALPLGNGVLGAMMFGKVDKEVISLNHNSLWSGYEKEEAAKPNIAADLKRVRELIMAGENAKAQEIADQTLLGEWSESYMPMGDLILQFFHDGPQKDYRMELDLEHAVALVSYQVGNIQYRRTCFVSYPDQVMVLRLESNQTETLAFDLGIQSMLKHTIRTSERCIQMQGQCPDHVEPNYIEDCPNPVVYEDPGKGMRFMTAISLQADPGAEVIADGEKLRIRSATACTLILSAENSYETPEFERCVYKRLEQAETLGYDALLSRHKEDFSTIYNRSVLKLGVDSDQPEDEKLQSFLSGVEELSLYADYYNYGRYLLLSSSRAGQPATLQGIWSWEMRPAWSSNWTTNINTPMNYWPAEVTNLSELHLVLIRWLDSLRESGRKTAREWFQCSGFCVNHNVDLWKKTTPASGSCQYSYWPMAGVWFCSHVFQHYRYTNDRKYLEELALPILEDCAAFCTDWVMRDPDGRYGTCPSTSPENAFYDDEGRVVNLCISSAMDLTLIREELQNYRTTCDILGIAGSLYEKAGEVLDQLADIKLTADGKIAEWSRDYRECDPGHRHLSLLYGIYPADTLLTQEAYREAAEKTLDSRVQNGSGTIGWGASWIVALAARLNKKEVVDRFLHVLLEYSSNNLFDIYNDKKAPFINQSAVEEDAMPGCFQIDGNFGGAAAIAELLLQCCYGYVELLPCIPDSWTSGSITGLCAYGDMSFDLSWENSRLTEVILHTGDHFDESSQVMIRMNGEKKVYRNCKKNAVYSLLY